MRRKSKVQIVESYPWKGVVLNVVSAFYFLTLSPYIEKISLDKFSGEKSYLPLLGLLLMILSVFEIYAFPKKMKLVKKLMKEKGKKAETGQVVLWFFHAAISMVTLMIILSAFGYDVTNPKVETPFWVALMMMVLFIKEVYFLLVIINEAIIDKKEFKKLKEIEMFYDIILVVYSWIAFSIIWTGVSKIGDRDMHSENIGLYIINLFAVSFIFFMTYLPIRIPHLLEETTLAKTKEDYFKFVFSILLILAALVVRL